MMLLAFLLSFVMASKTDESFKTSSEIVEAMEASDAEDEMNTVNWILPENICTKEACIREFQSTYPALSTSRPAFISLLRLMMDDFGSGNILRFILDLIIKFFTS
jgi:hypothetical protein